MQFHIYLKNILQVVRKMSPFRFIPGNKSPERVKDAKSFSSKEAALGFFILQFFVLLFSSCSITASAYLVFPCFRAILEAPFILLHSFFAAASCVDYLYFFFARSFSLGLCTFASYTTLTSARGNSQNDGHSMPVAKIKMKNGTNRVEVKFVDAFSAQPRIIYENKYTRERKSSRTLINKIKESMILTQAPRDAMEF